MARQTQAAPPADLGFPKVTTEAARRAFLDRFEREVDPDGSLPADVRASRAEAARRAYFTRLALRSSRARRRWAGAG